jgi:glycosyltransferase involved in cell wall biosynthesis
MKIALLTDAIFPNVIGGIQKHSYLLVKYFIKQNCNVDVYHSKINNDIDLVNYFTEIELSKINFIDCKYPSSYKFPGHYIYTSYKLSKLYYRILIGKDYNLIYAQGFTSWFTLKKEPFKSNLVTNLHGLEMFQHKINFKEFLKHNLLKIPANYIIKKSIKQISLGGKLTDILKNQSPKKGSIIEIPNAIEQDWLVDKVVNTNSKKFKFIFIGRYERRKGVEELTKVLKELIHTHNFEFHFVGPIPDSKKISNKNIIYHGLITDQKKIKSILMNIDILVCPSYSEGMPTVILEAMARGCAIIATNVGANCTMIGNRNGWLIDGDIKSGLKLSLVEALSLHRDKLLNMKKESVNIVSKNFMWEKVIEKTINEILI